MSKKLHLKGELSEQRALAMIQEILNGLHRSGLIESVVPVGADTVILGAGSALDSLGFVTFVADLEDRLSRETDKELSLVLNELHEFNADVPYLSAGTVAKYMVELTNGR
jgi:hypothetical protein